MCVPIQGYGNATLPSTPVTPSTLFYGGSTTKAFTTAAFAQLIDAGTVPGLSWRTSIASLIREDFVLQPSDQWAQEHLTLVSDITWCSPRSFQHDSFTSCSRDPLLLPIWAI